MLGRNGARILGEIPTALHVQIVVLALACIGTAVALFPVALWEFSLGVYLVVKRFKASPISRHDRFKRATGLSGGRLTVGSWMS